MLHSVTQDFPPGEAEGAPRRTPGRPWAKGTSGNPGGKPRRTVDGKSLPELARAYTAEALRVLAGIANNPKELSVTRIMATETILRRGWGDAPPVVQGGGEFRVVIEHVPVDPNAPRAPGVLRLPGDPATVSTLDVIDADTRDVIDREFAIPPSDAPASKGAKE